MITHTKRDMRQRQVEKVRGLKPNSNPKGDFPCNFKLPSHLKTLNSAPGRSSSFECDLSRLPQPSSPSLAWVFRARSRHRMDQESQASAAPRVCTLATLQGRYLFAESGVLLPPAFGVAVPTQAADVGFHIFNGDGTGTDIVTVRIGSTVVLENLVSPLVYTVNADCTGTITVSNGPSFDIFVAPDGTQFGSIATAPAGNYPASIVSRVSKR